MKMFLLSNACLTLLGRNEWRLCRGSTGNSWSRKSGEVVSEDAKVEDEGEEERSAEKPALIAASENPYSGMKGRDAWMIWDLARTVVLK